MIWKDDLEAYENSEARHLVRLFKAARPSEEPRAPANFCARVLHKIEARRARRGLLGWMGGAFTPAWAPALAAALILSLGVNVWFSLSVWESNGSGKQQVSEASREASHGGVPLNTYAFQAGIQSKMPLGALATEHPVLDAQATMFGFTGRPARANSFLIGALYAEALAYLHSDDRAGAKQRLSAIEQGLVQTQTSASLVQMINTAQRLVEEPTYASATVGAFVALFEPLYQAYARHHDTATLLLFQAGAWLENMHLAAVAGDKVALQQRPAVQYFLTEMRRLPAPKGVLNALEELDHVLAQPELTDRDVRTVRKLVKRLQDTLA